MQQRDALKANILSLALQESDTSETLMKFLQDNGLWDLVTAPGGLTTRHNSIRPRTPSTQATPATL